VNGSGSLWLFANIVAVLLGASIGSFLNVCIYRLPRRISIVSPSSFCPACGNRIKPYHNIPVLSYIFLRGRCAYCGARFSARYPLVEALTAALAWATLQRFGLSVPAPIYFVFLCALVVATFVDIEFKIIPDEITLGGLALGLLLSPLLPQGFVSSLFGAVLGGGILWLVAFLYERITGREGMGFGDVKLLAMMGCFLGARNIPLILLASSLAGSVVGVAMMVFFKKSRLYALPFGPFLALGGALSLFFGDAMWNLLFRF